MGLMLEVREVSLPQAVRYRMEDAGIEGEGNFRPGSRLQMAEEALKLGQVQSTLCGLAFDFPK